MLEVVRNNKKIALAIMAVVSLSFAFWGVVPAIEKTVAGDADAVADIGKTKITLQELTGKVRQAAEGAKDPAEAEKPEFRAAVNGFFGEMVVRPRV